jgi:hypothetical protein
MNECYARKENAELEESEAMKKAMSVPRDVHILQPCIHDSSRFASRHIAKFQIRIFLCSDKHQRREARKRLVETHERRTRIGVVTVEAMLVIGRRDVSKH